MTGHLFVIHGDLRRLACDALIIPCDSNGDVNRAWEELLPPERVRPGASDWLRVTGFEGPLATLPDNEGRAIHLVDTVGGMDSVDALVDRTVEAVVRAASTVQTLSRRALPLVALPLVGTGAGGLAHRRGAVVRALVERLTSEVHGSAYDVTLVARDPRDVAAIQQARLPQSWRELDDPLLASADRLGHKAARGELALFLGAGVSIPAGLPLWGQLLEELAKEASLPKPRLDSGVDYLRAAEAIKEVLRPEQFGELMRKRFAVRRYALGHGLVAGLSVQRLVTTNYDPCMELALEPVLGPKGFRVMTRHLAGGDKPWLLKLHGDIAKPETLILSESDYKRYADEGRALYGVVQGLMLTSHLLFVGFSLVDENFLGLAEAVSRVRREADALPVDHAVPVAGTALALRHGELDAERWKDDLDLVTLLQDGSFPGDLRDENQEAVARGRAARRLEIFLDRLAWTADRNRELSAQYFLDARYDDQFTDDPDTMLRERLRAFVRDLPADAARSSGWRAVEKALRDLGVSSRDLEKFLDARGRDQQPCVGQTARNSE